MERKNPMKNDFKKQIDRWFFLMFRKAYNLPNGELLLFVACKFDSYSRQSYVKMYFCCVVLFFVGTCM